MSQLPVRIAKKFGEINLCLTPWQQKRMSANLEQITMQMASAYNYAKGSAEYDLYARQIAVRYVNYMHARLCKELKSRCDRNAVAFKELTPRELFS